MKLELFILAVVGFYIYDAYHGGKIMKWIYSLKKYYKMATYIGIALFVYALIKSKDPRSKSILYYGANVIRDLPLDRSYVNALSPIFDLTGTGHGPRGVSFMEGLNGMEPAPTPYGRHAMPTKRSVSEPKKRYVAYSQDWKCANCGNMLNHTFEVDHKIRLEYGGSNDVTNLSALCRNCHGLKTAKENIAKSDL